MKCYFMIHIQVSKVTNILIGLQATLHKRPLIEKWFD